MYYAHIREDGQTQTVQEHLQGTAALCARFAAQFGEAERGEQLGLAHDIGKNSDEFQKRLQGGAKVDHATAGAIECAKAGDNENALCVIGHHGGIPDFGNVKSDTPASPTFVGRLRKGIAGNIPRYFWDGKLKGARPEPKFKNDFERAAWLRMLYSCLVDADYLDTEIFMSPKERSEYAPLAELAQRLQRYIEPWFPPQTELNAYRCDILKTCLEKANLPRGLYSLTVPTGGGKTVASLAFALNHAIAHGMQRVIYVIPYTSIIEQNAKVFREILGDENVLEHHSGVNYDKAEELSPATQRRCLAAENWDAPIVVTTAVQFFESLYANRPSQCRKLHNIANSVVIFDEAQMLPGCHLKPCVGAISNLVTYFGVSAVLCTATQPVLEDLIKTFRDELSVTELCPQTAQLYDRFRRVTYRDAGKLSNDALCDELARQRQTLCIVNTRKTAQELYARLPENGRYHLSTLMCPAQRKAVLDTVRERLREGLECRVVSTSLIEAGVDVDFPSVYRELAGMDSLIQAAGRCNREGKRAPEESIVTFFEGEAPAPLLQRINLGATRETLAGGGDPGDADTIRRYFTAWRSLIGNSTDKSETVKNLSKGISGCRLPFKTVAESFHLIDDNSKTVYIPLGEGENLCRKIIDGCADRADCRRAGQYGVNVYEQHYKALVSAGDVLAVDEGAGVLTNLALYDEQTGLSLHAEAGKADFI